MDITSIVKSLIAALIVGALGWWASVITLSWSDQSGAFIIGAISIIVAIATPWGVWLGASDRTTTSQGVAVFVAILLLIIGTMVGGLSFGWFTNWIWEDFGLGLLMAAILAAATAVINIRTHVFK